MSRNYGLSRWVLAGVLLAVASEALAALAAGCGEALSHRASLRTH